MTDYLPLLDAPPFPADRYATLADRIKTLLATGNDVVFVQAEAILALEAAATSLGRPGLVALNVVTSPYGGYFGEWLKRAGASVQTVLADPGRPVAIEAIGSAIGALPKIDLVAVVHAETSSGILNPLEEIAALARSRGALLVVDAVASVGGHPLAVDATGIDVCVIGAQKALGGPAGLSMLSVSPRAWNTMRPQRAPSSLSLLDLKTNWLDRGRGTVPGMPSAMEFWALEAALGRIEAEGLPARIERHQLAARATRRGLSALGVEPWESEPSKASALATAAPIPAGASTGEFLAVARRFGASISPGFGKVDRQLVRLDHAGGRADLDHVLANVIGFGTALQAFGVSADLNAASNAVVKAYGVERATGA